MLGWMMKRAAGGANAPEAIDGDTTLADQPDTPAPVFAARAFKSALGFGPSDGSKPDLKKTDHLSTVTRATDMRATPVKTQPQGILLTPGTGTTRRKRVSFGHDVGAKMGSTQATDRATDNPGPTRKRTRLGATLEANRKNTKKSAVEPDAAAQQDNTDSEWEEEDIDEADVTQEMTTDFAEPHSESGKYWKQEFQRYRDDARVEMDKMLKYKSLAKSYAKLKDAEAMELAEMLRAEQERVIAMEKKISESASTIVSQQKRAASEKAMAETVTKLTKQTALAIQYRQRVQELENQLEDLVRSKEAGAGTDDSVSIAELRRELRNAQAQIRENERLRKQIEDLKAKLKAAKEESRGRQTPSSDNARTQELRAALREARNDNRRKDEEIRQLRREHTNLQQQAGSQQEEVKTLLARSQSRYAELKKEMAALKASGHQTSRPKSWHVSGEETGAGEAAEEHTEDVLAVSASAVGRNTAMERRESLRDKYRKDARPDSYKTQPPAKALDLDSPQKMTTELPRAQPNVRRSLRNKKSVGDLAPGHTALGSSRSLSIATPNMPVLDDVVKNAAGSAAANKAPDGEVDLLKSQFARLGGPEPAGGSNSTALGNTTARSTLPPERRAAAMARIEKKRQERQKVRTRNGNDKENMRPIIGV